MGREPIPMLILIFRGTHQVLSAEKRLKKAGVPVRLIPAPKRLSSDCGLAIRISLSDQEIAREVLSRAGIRLKSVHVLHKDGEYAEEPR